MTRLTQKVYIHASHIPVGDAIDGNVFDRLVQFGEDYLEIERRPFLTLETEHLAITVGHRSTTAIDGSCRLVEDNALVTT